MFPEPRNGSEVQPPDGRTREEGHNEGDDRRRSQVGFGRGGADQDNGLSQSEDDEQPEALGEVLGPNVPRGSLKSWPSRYPEQDERRSVVERERGQPQRRSHRLVH